MKSALPLFLLLALSMASCNMDAGRTMFVESGVPSSLIDLHEAWFQEEGYLKSQEEFYLPVEKAIPSGEFKMQITLELNSYECVLNIVAGDNSFGFNSMEEELPGEFFMEGPSFHKAHRTGFSPEEVIPLDTPFEIEVRYKDEKLSCSVNGREIISREVVNEPFGRIMLEGWSEDAILRLYDWSFNGELVSLEECYTREKLLSRAQNSVEKRAAEVSADPNRPIYHLQPPASWNNDPNGTLHYDGYYHMFYQHNPFADHWNWMHWGHMRSKDLVKWEHLPIALWPSIEKGEMHCFSGSAIVNRKGEPMLFYTSIGHEDPEHWIAVPKDDDLIEWQKHPGNPILTIDDHDGEVIEEWRDPQLIHEGDETLMVIGGHPEDKGGSIMLYKALNVELTKWDYLGVAFTGDEENWECPNFFRVGDKWVVIYSPHGRVMYYTGDFDMEDYRFTPEQHGAVDMGSNFYAPNTMEDAKGRRLLWGWIPGFKEDQGWQGAMTLPRNIKVTSEGWLIQEPVEELTGLRGEQIRLEKLPLYDESMDLDVPGHEFEMITTFSGAATEVYGIRMNLEEEGEVFEISLADNMLNFGEREISLEPYRFGDDISFRIFFDRTIIELYLNGGMVCATSVVYPDRKNPGWQLFSEGGAVMVEMLDIWELNSIY
jgi:beta-fructofuranosidase